MDLVVNEWLPEYFRPEASKIEKQNLELFLNKFLEKKDKLIVRRPSEFLSKIYRYSKNYQYDRQASQELRKFIKFILLDSERCFLVDDDEFYLPEAIERILISGGNTISDIYLFEAASAIDPKIIITTDGKLKALMENETTFKVILLDVFLSTY